MTGTEDGMPSLAAKSLTTLKGEQNPRHNGPIDTHGTISSDGGNVVVRRSYDTRSFANLALRLIRYHAWNVLISQRHPWSSRSTGLVARGSERVFFLELMEEQGPKARSTSSWARHAYIPQCDAPLLDLQQRGCSHRTSYLWVFAQTSIHSGDHGAWQGQA